MIVRPGNPAGEQVAMFRQPGRPEISAAMDRKASFARALRISRRCAAMRRMIWQRQPAETEWLKLLGIPA